MVTNIVLFGRTGAGKSTIANMILNKEIKSSNTFDIDDSATGVTLACNMASKGDVAVYDTVGLGEADSGSVSHKDATDHIINYLKMMCIPLNYICIVKDGRDRVDDLDQAIFGLAKVIFQGAFQNAVLIITHQKDAWVKLHKNEIDKYYGTEICRIAVDFPYIDCDPAAEAKNVATRLYNYNKLTTFFTKLQYTPVKPNVCKYKNNDDVLKNKANTIKKFMMDVFAVLRTGVGVAMLVLTLLTQTGVI